MDYGGPPDDAWGKIAAQADALGLIRHGRIGQAECQLFRARAVVDLYEQALRTDPWGLFGVPRLPTSQSPQDLPDLRM